MVAQSNGPEPPDLSVLSLPPEALAPANWLEAASALRWAGSAYADDPGPATRQRLTIAALVFGLHEQRVARPALANVLGEGAVPEHFEFDPEIPFFDAARQYTRAVVDDRGERAAMLALCSAARDWAPEWRRLTESD